MADANDNNGQRLDLDGPRPDGITLAMWRHLQRVRRGRYCTVGGGPTPAEAVGQPMPKKNRKCQR